MSSILQNEKAVKAAVQNSKSVKEALLSLGLRAAGGNYKSFYLACERFNLTAPKDDYSDRIGRLVAKRMIPLEDILVENSTYTSNEQLKKRLVASGYFEWKCYGVGCTVTDEWCGAPLMLQLEHKNGVHNDNRLENLEFLCPNCHSQTATFAGRSSRVHDQTYCHCGSTKSRKAVTCISCDRKSPERGLRRLNRNTKIVWPEDSELIAMVEAENFSKVAQKLGVSDNAIRHRMKARNLL